jgi:RHS repeat-associated protein
MKVGQATEGLLPASIAGSNQDRAPSISLPKGGGALRSIDEKFSVNSINGTCELTITLPASKTRSGLDGALALRYNSGSGNGPFGLGWSLTLPSIQRRTDKQLPRYADADESDVFLFGSEDLVPASKKDLSGAWIPDVADDGPAHAVRYRPRIESEFSRIEKIAVKGEIGFFWKVITRDNVATVLGRSSAARLADPADPSRIFRWFPEWMYDDKGNCVEFIYKAEDDIGIPVSVEEQNRQVGLAPFANRYLQRVRYGNQNPYFPSAATPLTPAPPVNPLYFFDTVFDYGGHDDVAPTPAETRAWPCRFDPFSEYRAGFEIRTYRLCRRILFFHTFTELNDPPSPGAIPTLVRSLDFDYLRFRFDGTPHRQEEADLISAIRRVHYRRSGANSYDSRSLPALELSYHDVQWNTDVRTILPEDVVNAPAGAGAGYQWTDLDGFGVPGLLTEQAASWHYKSNLGDGHFGRGIAVASTPTLAGLGSGALQLLDLDADGGKQAVIRSGGLQGYFELTDANEWLPFRTFEQMPSVDFTDPNTRLLDLDGDGRPDLVISEEQAFRWYPSLGTRGFDSPRSAAKPFEEERGPAVVFADGSQTIFLADMSGDGLGDIVRVRNGEVCYWPNLGYGRFGAKVTMANAPVFDRPEHFDPTAIRFADISGTGAADLIYLGGGGFSAWINLAGNGWSDVHTIDPFPGTEAPNQVSVLDLLGNGTAAMVWSSELPASVWAPLRFIDLMGGKKPYILCAYRNNLGLAASFEYRSSSAYALLDREEGHPWVTKLPFPTMCLSRAETNDVVSGARFVREFRYRHGYYDHAEREFRGFGMVEEVDTESFERFSKSGASNVVDSSLHQAPRRIRTWYHTGAHIQNAGILTQFQNDYYRNAAAPEFKLPDAVIEAETTLSPEESRQAARACKGMVLRQEVFADDGTPDAAVPFSTSTHNCHIRLLQPMGQNRYAVFLAHESEAITYHYERKPQDPRIAHELNTVIDEFGHIVESASVVYGRATADGSLPPEVQIEQERIRVRYTVNGYTSDVDSLRSWRVRLLCETRAFELTGVPPAAACFTLDELRNGFISAVPLGFESSAHPGLREKRLLQHQRTLFAQDANVDSSLPLGVLGTLGIHFEDYRLALTPSLRTTLYNNRVTDPMLVEGGYVEGDSYKAGGLFPSSDPGHQWWAPSGTVGHPALPDQHFYLPERYIDPHGAVTRVRYYTTYHLLIDRVEDALHNPTDVLAFDWRFLQPTQVRDINDNIVEASVDILGLVVGTAVKGKGAEADDLTGFVPDLTQAQIDAFLIDPVGSGAALLQHATTRFIYDFVSMPAVAASIARETHHQVALARGVVSELQYAFEYSDGLGRVAMRKTQAEPGKARRCDVHPDGTYTITEIDTTPNRRWCGTGRVVQNNKGNSVMAFESYFSTTHGFESAKELVESGVTPLLQYDPIDRLIRTDLPDGSFSTVRFDAWTQQSFDQNDNVLASAWYAARSAGALGSDEQSAAQKAAMHDGTPVTEHFDSLGRSVCSARYNRFRDRTSGTLREEFPQTVSALDIEGHRLAVTDARGIVVMTYRYDLLGQTAHTGSMDAGERWMLNDVSGKPLHAWDTKGSRFHTAYDALRRPTSHDVLPLGGALIVLERSEYGNNKAANQNGKLITQHDPSGLVTHARYDFKGNVEETSRRFAVAYNGMIDWTNPATFGLQLQTFATTISFDALNRVEATTTPDGSMTSPRYGEANLMTGIDVGLHGAPAKPFVTKVIHDAKGQRQRIEYGNGVSADFTYDSLTFRLRRMLTKRASDAAVLQDLNYTYDPIGNITRIMDQAQQTLYFNNQKILPHSDFVYDAIYRLVSATGREHIGQNAPVSQFDEFRTNLPHPADGTAMQNYLQQYEYDVADNLIVMAHSAGVGALAQRWTRRFTPDAASNRLSTSDFGGTTESYGYDPHGNLAALPGLGTLGWNLTDHLASVDLGGGGTAYYAYDASGARVRKVVTRQGGGTEERLYLGTLEQFTRTGGAGSPITRESLHVMDGQRRLAMVDSRTAGNDGTPAELVRYQFANHLGTAALELDDAGLIISYEEYYPYGNSSFQSVDGARQVPAKRYRYTGKERDEETGLYYHGARYYAPWLGRWVSCDPAGIKDGENLYRYVLNNPLALHDPTGLQAVGGLSKESKDALQRFVDPQTLGRVSKHEAETHPRFDSQRRTANDLCNVMCHPHVLGETATGPLAHFFQGLALGALASTGPVGLVAALMIAWVAVANAPTKSTTPLHSSASTRELAVTTFWIAGVPVLLRGGGALAKRITGGRGGGVVPSGAGAASSDWYGGRGAPSPQYRSVKEVLTEGGTQNPQFPSYHDVELPERLIGPKVSDRRQFSFAMKDLKRTLENNPSGWSEFSPRQQEAIKAAFEAGKPRPLGFVWHHHEDFRFLQLVDEELHRIAHFGGRFVTGGRP